MNLKELGLHYTFRRKGEVHHKSAFSDEQIERREKLRAFLQDGPKKPREVCKYFGINNAGLIRLLNTFTYELPIYAEKGEIGLI